jgi:two-component system, NtrC family, sensor histidine kinase HydH
MAGRVMVVRAIAARAATAINPGAAATNRAAVATAAIRDRRIETASSANSIKPIRDHGWAFLGLCVVPTEAYAELAELAGGFIHEIKNHLSTLGLNIQLLAEDFQQPQNQRERRALERISRLQSECQRLVDVSNDFLRFARVKDLELAPGNLVGVVAELVDFFMPMARQSGIDIKSYLPGDLPPVQLNNDLFRQALLNLMLNAQQAMPEGGELTIQAAHEPEGICLSLIDTGKGMTADAAARAFRPFFSTKPGGTGLGLATTRKIVEAHGGTIALQSEVGRGTKISITLPETVATPETDDPSHAMKSHEAKP